MSARVRPSPHTPLACTLCLCLQISITNMQHHFLTNTVGRHASRPRHSTVGIMRSHENCQSQTHGNIYFHPWGGQQRRVLAIKGKTPGSKPRDLFFSWAFFASCVLEGYECQSPSNPSELPRYLDASLSPKHYLSTFTSSNTPRPLQPSRPRCTI